MKNIQIVIQADVPDDFPIDAVKARLQAIKDETSIFNVQMTVTETEVFS
ncbi:hypothetical protein KAR91_45875 [Candidatus Pacearchaeota archaeon]|nr:hypothetical protein [Candidatus Pacearchaeota archaeon]